jgi:hypothetical protein
VSDEHKRVILKGPVAGPFEFRHQQHTLWRVAQASDLAGITDTLGAPFLRVFCEGAGVGNAGATSRVSILIFARSGRVL